VLSVGVKVTLCAAAPTAGVVVGVVNAKLPATEPVPPLSVEEASVCPYVIALAVGHAEGETVGVALFTVTLTVPVTEE
jgi:hypothetical protein